MKNPTGKLLKHNIDSLLKEQGYIYPSFEIYGGSQGLIDYGPLGATLKSNIINIWRKMFVYGENNYEVDCTIITPEPVFKASGHVAKFTDYITYDSKQGSHFRADHLIKASLNNVIQKSNDVKLTQKAASDLNSVDNCSKDELEKLMRYYQIKAPENGNDLTEISEFNLMFKTNLGVGSNKVGYLRPETAQGMFVNFPRLLTFNHGKLPLGIAQIGKAFRNEISPRGGLLRVREFDMAEIEYFYNPDDNFHPKFNTIKDIEINFLSREKQIEGHDSGLKLSINKALESQMVSNTLLAYYIAKSYKFLLKVGVDESKIRARQHLSKEMAHYASDCWDLEILIDENWVECVGLADRCSFDLNCHQKATGAIMNAQIPLEKPVKTKELSLNINKRNFFPSLKQKANPISQYLEALDQKDLQKYSNLLVQKGQFELENEFKDTVITSDMITITTEEKTTDRLTVTPQVIEPSFGLGRIITAILEHNCYCRQEDPNRVLLNLPAEIAPIKVCVLPMMKNELMIDLVQSICSKLADHGISHITDCSGASIGRRYSRADARGIPFVITVDFDSIAEASPTKQCTLRERASMKQVLVPVNDLLMVLFQLNEGMKSWKDIMVSYPIFNNADE